MVQYFGGDAEVLTLRRDIMETIQDVGRWGQVIRRLLAMSGAAKGILALRAHRDSEFTVPTGVLSSPLIINFDMEYVETFVTRYAAVDPWTEIEDNNPPLRPYALSRYLPVEKLRQTEFWEWLEPQGISDTVVVRIGGSEGQWVGMNLFFPAEDEATRDRTLALLNEVLPDLCRAWEIGESIRGAAAGGMVQLKEITFLPLPAFFCRSDGTTHMVTERLAHMVTAVPSLFRTVEPSIRFQNPENQTVFREQLLRAVDIGRAVSADLICDGRKITLNLSRIAESEDVIGRRKEQYLGVIVDPEFEAKCRIEDEQRLADLTHRERELFDYLAQPGTTIEGFAEAIGKSRHTADFHWRSLKQKLGIRTLRELRQFHGVD